MSYLLYKPVLNGQEVLLKKEEYQKGVYARIIELLDGERAIDDVISTLLLEKYSVTEVMDSIKILTDEKIIAESKDSDLGVFSKDEIAEFGSQIHAFSKLSFDKGGIFLPYTKNSLKHQRALKEAKICIIGRGGVIVHFVRHLVSVGIGDIYTCVMNDEADSGQETAEEIAYMNHGFSKIHNYVLNPDEKPDEFIKNNPSTLVVYLSETFSESEALMLNKLCHENKKDLLPYHLDFPTVYIGPFYRYKQSACFQCYTLRKRGAINDFIPRKEGAEDITSFNMPLGIEMLCLEVIKYFTYVLDVATIDCVWSLDIISGKTKILTAFKLPRCPICGVHKLKPAQKLWENI